MRRLFVARANIVRGGSRLAIILQDCVQSEGKLYLIFEFVDRDLKKYMESTQGMLDPMLVKVRGGDRPAPSRLYRRTGSLTTGALRSFVILGCHAGALYDDCLNYPRAAFAIVTESSLWLNVRSISHDGTRIFQEVYGVSGSV